MFNGEKRLMRREFILSVPELEMSKAVDPDVEDSKPVIIRSRIYPSVQIHGIIDIFKRSILHIGVPGISGRHEVFAGNMIKLWS